MIDGSLKIKVKKNKTRILLKPYYQSREKSEDVEKIQSIFYAQQIGKLVRM